MMRKTYSWQAWCLLLLINSAQLAAAPLGEAIARGGNGNGAPPCQSCHGDRGQGTPAAAYPYLAGQSADYLTKQLKDLASKGRATPVMQPIASALTATEIDALASYYSSMPLPAIATSANNAAQGGLGETLANKGKWSVGMPACFQCHGDKGQGVAPHIPAISGQSSAYLKAQLNHWQEGTRSNDAIGLMQAVVSHLDDAEISAVAEYLAAQSPTASPAAGAK